MYSIVVEVWEPQSINWEWETDPDELSSPLDPARKRRVGTITWTKRYITFGGGFANLFFPEEPQRGGGGGYGGGTYNNDVPLYLRTGIVTPTNQKPEDYYRILPVENAINPNVNTGSIALAVPVSVSLGEWLASSFATGGVKGLAATAMVTVGIPIVLMATLSGDSERPDKMEIAQNMVRAEAIAKEQAAQAAEYERTRYRRAQWHHIATFYGGIGALNTAIFNEAGMNIFSDPNNLMYMVDHCGRHTTAYNAYVFNVINSYTAPYRGSQFLFRDALIRALNELRFEILTGGLRLYK